VKAFTIYQPWASLIMIGAKPFEFREWDYRKRERGLVGQRIVIHAAARPIKMDEVEDVLRRMDDGESSLVDDLARPLLERVRSAYRGMGIVEMSAGLGTAIIGEPRTVADLFGGKGHDSNRLNHHMWGWPLTDVRPFPAPILCRGAQGFWSWPFPYEAAA
jgi:hypothetical protein